MADELLIAPLAPSFEFIGWESNATVSGSVSITVPALVVSSVDYESLAAAIPAVAAAFEGTVGVASVLTNTIMAPAPVASFAGGPGVIGTVGIAVPAAVVYTAEGNDVNARVPAVASAFEGAGGAVGEMAATLPAITAEATGEVEFSAGFAMSVAPGASFGGTTGVVGSVTATLAGIALATEGHTGIIGRVSIDVPMVRAAVGGGQDVVGAMSITLPALTLVASGRIAAVGVTQGYALRPVKTSENKPEVMALSLYDDLPAFNSMAVFNGVYLAATAAGIFALSGELDAAAPINALIRTGSTDFGTSHLKRVEAVWLQYETTGSLTLTVITDGGVRHSYPVPPTGSTGLHGVRVPVGRGIKSKYWAFEVANVAGCSFGMDLIEARPQVLARRHGGGNA